MGLVVCRLAITVHSITYLGSRCMKKGRLYMRMSRRMETVDMYM